jgi:hypothetical protein
LSQLLDTAALLLHHDKILGDRLWEVGALHHDHLALQPVLRQALSPVSIATPDAWWNRTCSEWMQTTTFWTSDSFPVSSAALYETTRSLSISSCRLHSTRVRLLAISRFWSEASRPSTLPLTAISGVTRQNYPPYLARPLSLSSLDGSGNRSSSCTS